MGFIGYMVASLKNNKRERVSAFERMKAFKEGVNIQVHFDKKATKHQLKDIKIKLQQENNIGIIKNILTIVFVFIVLIYIMGFVKF